MKRMKQILASTLVAIMVIAGLMITPLDVKAADTVTESNGVEYVLDTTKYDFKNFWNKDAEQRKVPTKDGYVFGGWYKDVEGTKKALTQTEAEGITDSSNIWAKFVPAEVLSIRAQLEKSTETYNGKTEDGSAAKESTYLRLLSGVNGLDYQKVGFDILYNKKKQDSEANREIATNITKVFSKITNEETGENGMEADELFGDAATHFSVLRLNKILAKNFELVIYVTPQWTTLDGTLVKGHAKYVRVMDGYAENGYISVPVNFTEGSEVAAGQMELKYDPAKVELVTKDDKGFDAGLIMPEMSYYDDKNGTIKIVGNVETGKTKVEPETGIYANVWFKVKSGATVDNTVLNFTFDNLSFANWSESFVTDLHACNYQYLK